MPGSITKIKRRDKRGWYVYQITIPLGPARDGDRARVTRVYYSEKDLSAREKARVRDDVYQEVIAEQQRPAEAALTLHAWASQWLIDKARTCAPATIYHYRGHLSNWILPELADVQLHEITAPRIIAFLDKLATARRTDHRAGPTTLTAYTRAKILRTLSICLQAAVYRQIIPHNPAHAVQAPKFSRKEAKFLTGEQIERFATALLTEPLRFRAFVTLALATGARCGELTALTWEDIDLQAFTVRFDKAADCTAGTRQTAKTTKHDVGNRVIPIPSATARLLLALWEEQIAARTDWEEARERRQAAGKKLPPMKRPCWSDNTHVFLSAHGHWYRSDQFCRDFPHFIERHHLPLITLHGLRHTVATQLLQVLDIRTVAYLLGHRQTSTTLNIYAHVLNPDTRQAAEHMGSIIYH